MKPQNLNWRSPSLIPLAFLNLTVTWCQPWGICLRLTSQSHGNRCWPGDILFFLFLVLALLTSCLSMRLPSGSWKQLCRDGDNPGRNAYVTWRIHQALPRALKRLAAIHWINTATTAAVLRDPSTPISLSQLSMISYPYWGRIPACLELS